ncbi:MAG: hypothetical protein ACPGQL_00415 [Thermoplasmatota archaeon]
MQTAWGGRPVDETILDHLRKAIEKEKTRVESARWTAVMGVILMFAGQIMTAFALGGAAMTLWGSAAWIVYARRLARLEQEEWDAMGLPDPFDTIERVNNGEWPEGPERPPTDEGD